MPSLLFHYLIWWGFYTKLLLFCLILCQYIGFNYSGFIIHFNIWKHTFLPCTLVRNFPLLLFQIHFGKILITYKIVLALILVILNYGWILGELIVSCYCILTPKKVLILHLSSFHIALFSTVTWYSLYNIFLLLFKFIPRYFKIFIVRVSWNFTFYFFSFCFFRKGFDFFGLAKDPLLFQNNFSLKYSWFTVLC